MAPDVNPYLELLVILKTGLEDATPRAADDKRPRLRFLPGTITDEARQAWRNVADILSRAGASLTDIVSVRQWLTNAEDVDAYVAVRGEFIHHEPVAMLAVVTGLVWPNIAVEIEVIAARPATG